MWTAMALTVGGDSLAAVARASAQTATAAAGVEGAMAGGEGEEIPSDNPVRHTGLVVVQLYPVPSPISVYGPYGTRVAIALTCGWYSF